MRLAPYVLVALLTAEALAGGVVCVKHSTPPDTTAPNAIIDLAAGSPTSSTCTLTFSAPYDDAPSTGGAVSSYDCRVCDQGTCSTTMDGTEYTAATLVSNEPTPSAPLTSESFAATVSGGLAEATAYTFNCKSVDDSGNTSGLSNSATCTTSSFCDGSFQFCDDFTATNDPPSGWTEEFGTTWATTGGELVSPTTGSDVAIRYSTNAGGLTQYAIVKFGNYVSEMGLELRANRTSGAFRKYTVYVNNGATVYWTLNDTVSGGQDSDVASCAMTFTSGDYLIAKVSGTAGTTVMQVWKSSGRPLVPPSGTASCTFTTGTGCSFTGPATACTCISSKCTPDQTADTGLAVGIYNGNTTVNKRYDNFAGGGS